MTSGGLLTWVEEIDLVEDAVPRILFGDQSVHLYKQPATWEGRCRGGTRDSMHAPLYATRRSDRSPMNPSNNGEYDHRDCKTQRELAHATALLLMDLSSKTSLQLIRQ